MSTLKPPSVLYVTDSPDQQFQSIHSYKFFLRQHKRRLAELDAIAWLDGKIHVDVEKFASAREVIAREEAKRRFASAAATSAA